MGVAFHLLLIPFIMVISAACAYMRRKIAEVTDQRISLMNELVSGIRTLKANAWERNYREKVHEVRRWVGRSFKLIDLPNSYIWMV